MYAIDTTSSILGNVHNILYAGYHGILRYASPDTELFPQKRIKPEEISAIHSVPGMALGLVYETAPTNPDYFTVDRATSDANNCLELLDNLGAPNLFPMFFTADFDADSDTINNLIIPYLTQIHTLFDPTGYLVGIYGSGSLCEAASSEGVVHYTWLAQSRGWSGYLDWKVSADIIQGPESTIAGLDSDTDYVVNESVLWKAPVQV